MSDEKDRKAAAEKNADDQLKETVAKMTPEQRAKFKQYAKEHARNDDQALYGVPEHLADYVRAGEMSDTELANFQHRVFSHYSRIGKND